MALRFRPGNDNTGHDGFERDHLSLGRLKLFLGSFLQYPLEMSFRVFAVTWPCIACVAISCVSSEEAPTPPPAPTADSVAAIASAYCERLSVCNGTVFTQVLLGDVATCQKRFAAELTSNLKGNGVTVTDAQAVRCAAAAKSLRCDAIFDALLPECDFRGSLTDGASCAADLQCASGSCFLDPNQTCGKCTLRALAGGDCSVTKCADGLTCADKKCVKRAVEGEACNAAKIPCANGLDCFGGKCVKGLAPNAACSRNDYPCDLLQGLYCKPASLTDPKGTCTPLTFASPGKPCGFSTDPIDFVACTDQSTCVGEGAKPGTCTSFLPDGATCTPEGVACQFPASCRDGKCAMTNAVACK